MKIYEYGKENPEKVLLIHPSLVTWDYFEYVIPLLEEHYHLLIPALPGYDLENDSEFSSVEKIAAELADDLQQRGIRELKAIYGCSMGGSIVLRMAADGRLNAAHYIMDGGITPYQLPWILTRFIALRDFGMMALGKLGGEKLIVKAFSSTEFSEDDLKYVANIFRHCTYKTLWNTFDSTNNYKMSKQTMRKLKGLFGFGMNNILQGRISIIDAKTRTKVKTDEDLRDHEKDDRSCRRQSS